MKISDYPMVIRSLSDEEGGGVLVEYPDLPGCMADGDTLEEAIREGEDAVKAWIATAKAEGKSIPQPNKFKKYSGQFRARIPKSLHADLARRAELEGVSLNTMAITLLAEGLSKVHDLNSNVDH